MCHDIADLSWDFHANHVKNSRFFQISSLYAQVHGLTRIIFAGYFIRGHPVTMHTMSYAVNFFSKVSDTGKRAFRNSETLRECKLLLCNSAGKQGYRGIP